MTTPCVVWIVARCRGNSVRDGWLHFVVDGVRRAGTSSRRGWLLGYQLWRYQRRHPRCLVSVVELVRWLAIRFLWRMQGQRCSSSSQGWRRIHTALWQVGTHATAIPAAGTAFAASMAGLWCCEWNAPLLFFWMCSGLKFHITISSWMVGVPNNEVSFPCLTGLPSDCGCSCSKQRYSNKFMPLCLLWMQLQPQQVLPNKECSSNVLLLNQPCIGACASHRYSALQLSWFDFRIHEKSVYQFFCGVCRNTSVPPLHNSEKAWKKESSSMMTYNDKAFNDWLNSKKVILYVTYRKFQILWSIRSLVIKIWCRMPLNLLFALNCLYFFRSTE